MTVVLPDALPPTAGRQPDEPAIIPQDMHPPVDLAEDLDHFLALVATYLPPEEVSKIGEAYHFSAQAHLGQYRISGEPYISHPLAVAESLAGWRLDAQALVAALLHDVMEDTVITKEEIASRFGHGAAELVDGVSKLDRIENQPVEVAQAENYRKMLLAMTRDVRVILIKLADRLHNMRTLDAVRPDKCKRIARETLDIYAPIANRLGLNTLYRELQELSFRHLHPMRYRVLSKAVKATRGNRREVVGKILEAIRRRLPECNIEAEVTGREKHLYGIYQKMKEKRKTFSQVLDIYGFRIIVKDVPTCYLALGALHSLYKPIPGTFKDYVAIPKANGYQSLHTTLLGPYGTPIETQIRTQEMNHIAETGVAAHWLYKDDTALRELQKTTHRWLQSLVELQSTAKDPTEFMESVKVDLYPGEVYVFTPQGKILVLPRGSSAIDFAYAIHSDIGNACVACRINFEPMPLRTELRTGDQVEIITAPTANPNPAWLEHVRTGKARAQIRHFLKTRQQEQSTALGERLLRQALNEIGQNFDDLTPVAWDRLLRDAGARSRDEIHADIGLGKRLAAVVARRLLLHAAGLTSEGQGHGSVIVRGTEGTAVQFARCCRPIPGDPIIGSIRKGQGLIVHTHDCPVIRKARRHDPDRWIDVEWHPDPGRLFEVRIGVTVDNQPGVLAKVAAAIANAESNIDNVAMDSEQGIHSTLYFTIQVENRLHLARIMRDLRRIQQVVRVTRLKE